MEENVEVPSPVSSVCPLCSSEVRYFFIHMNEKLLMCENTECDFPFGYEELQFTRVEQGEEIIDTVSNSIPSHKQISPASSAVSSSCMSDIDKLNRVADETLIEPKMLSNPKKVNKKIISHRESEKQIKKNVEDLKELTLELNDMTSTRKTIRNQKWIKNLMNLQDHSGFKLLKPEELKKFSKTEDVKNELKIDIEAGSSGCVSSIKIELANQGEDASTSGVT
ncbi:uncharacterized protein LOC120630006 isoform X2 [Pararge aegeria]|uniref:uncharacterized protein LOC120630006 isoform X2 n=1 Tax=Pararge aegeria TaxID=116150 RepID=UPI0019D002CD|nr:uncharacterized protein LOC120630006 isoform X2 [Pararge aegeria]